LDFRSWIAIRVVGEACKSLMLIVKVVDQLL